MKNSSRIHKRYVSLVDIQTILVRVQKTYIVGLVGCLYNPASSEVGYFPVIFLWLCLNICLNHAQILRSSQGEQGVKGVVACVYVCVCVGGEAGNC